MKSWERRKELVLEGWVVFPAGAKSLLFTVWFCSGQAEFKGCFVFGYFWVWGLF